MRQGDAFVERVVLKAREQDGVGVALAQRHGLRSLAFVLFGTLVVASHVGRQRALLGLGTGGAGGTGSGGSGSLGGSSTGGTGVTAGTGTGGGSGTAGTGGTTGTGTRGDGPCDVYAAASMPCAAAYSTVRALSKAYTGPLFQIRNGSSVKNTGSGGMTKDIMMTADGYADTAAVDAF